MTIPTKASTASSTPTRMTRRFDRFTDMYPFGSGVVILG